MDDITTAAHMLKYHALKKKESESGAEFFDREMCELHVTWALMLTTVNKFI